jgi:hypothetical protein
MPPVSPDGLNTAFKELRSHDLMVVQPGDYEEEK